MTDIASVIGDWGSTDDNSPAAHHSSRRRSATTSSAKHGHKLNSENLAARVGRDDSLHREQLDLLLQALQSTTRNVAAAATNSTHNKPLAN